MMRGQLFRFGATSLFHKVQQSLAAPNPPILNAPALNIQENCAPQGHEEEAPFPLPQHSSTSPCNGNCSLLLGAHGDPALQVVELAKVFPQCAAALEVPGHVHGALGRQRKRNNLHRAGQHTGRDGKGPSARLACKKVCRWEQVPFCKGQLSSQICWHPHDKHTEKKMSVCSQIMLYGTNLWIQSNEIKKEEPAFSLSQSETIKRRNLRATGNVSCL